jgi:hypothetical protein
VIARCNSAAWDRVRAPQPPPRERVIRFNLDLDALRFGLLEELQALVAGGLGAAAGLLPWPLLGLQAQLMLVVADAELGVGQAPVWSGALEVRLDAQQLGVPALAASMSSVQ